MPHAEQRFTSDGEGGSKDVVPPRRRFRAELAGAQLTVDRRNRRLVNFRLKAKRARERPTPASVCCRGAPRLSEIPRATVAYRACEEGDNRRTNWCSNDLEFSHRPCLCRGLERAGDWARRQFSNAAGTVCRFRLRGSKGCDIQPGRRRGSSKER